VKQSHSEGFDNFCHKLYVNIQQYACFCNFGRKSIIIFGLLFNPVKIVFEKIVQQAITQSLFCAQNYILIFSSLTVVLGTTQYKNPGQSFFTTNFLCHPQYSSRTIDYDYAIVTISGASLNSAVS